MTTIVIAAIAIEECEKMRNALIDVGSNTIRFVAYDGNKEIDNYADYAGLIAEVKDGELSAGGIGKIINALSKMNIRAESLGCKDIYAFATASLRDIKDKSALISLIKELCGIELQIISGEDEAKYDYYGLRAVNNVKDGAAFDLGGGSCQILVFSDNEVLEWSSFPIGSLKLHSEFVSGILPDIYERDAISEHVSKNISKLNKFHHCGCKVLYGMGGAAFALSALSAEYLSGHVTWNELSKICTFSEEQITAVVPKRLKTVIPAALTMMELLKYSGAELIIPTKAGVREGILHTKLPKN